LEFSHYDVKSTNTIPVKDFALSMVASADMNHINKLLDRVDDLNDNPDLKDLRITFEV
jgi:calcium uptake protein 1, mitochondrial